MWRRELLAGVATLAGMAWGADRLFAVIGGASLASAQTPASSGDGVPFDAHLVRQRARDLAARPFKPGNQSLPKSLDDLSYDQYRNIRFDAERAIWGKQGLPFELQLLHRGFLFRDRVDIAIVAEGKARPVPYNLDWFRFEHGMAAPEQGADLGLSGFRLHGPLNRSDYYDEVAVFQGASYFRAVAKGQVYGSSARGLSLKTGHASGEEFPAFKSFWIERPRAGVNSIVIHALLDSPSAAAALRFTIVPGESTVFTVETTLYPRVDLDQVGLGSLTSMFFFGPNDRDGIDDFRPTVCDANGLAMLTGNGEMIWRPLTNPRRLQLSAFADSNTRGFGLMQRQRSFFDYQDLEAQYEKRPSVWVEPVGAWGEGAVHLVEIPTREEVHDNIVAFWRPKEPLRQGAEYNHTYRLHWTWDMRERADLARFGATRVGGVADRRLFVMDILGPSIKGLSPASLRAEVKASRGAIADVVVHANPNIGGIRLAFSLEPKGTDLSELRAVLLHGSEPVSETWIYRWTS